MAGALTVLGAGGFGWGSCRTAMVLHGAIFAPFGDIRQFLETFLVVTTEGELLASSGWRPGVLLGIL